MAEGSPVYFPLAGAGWVDLVVQTPHGFNRIQVKTCAASKGNGAFRVRNLGADPDAQLTPQDRYDILVVLHRHRAWSIPASVLGHRDTITIHPEGHDCPFTPYRMR